MYVKSIYFTNQSHFIFFACHSNFSSSAIAAIVGYCKRASSTHFLLSRHFVYTTITSNVVQITQLVIFFNYSFSWMIDPLGVKQQGQEAEHSPPSTAKVKLWSYIYLNSLVFMA
jgi:hypothetical protein